MQNLLFVLRAGPHGSINAQEGLDALLMGSAFAACSALFLDDGLLALKAGQVPDELGLKDVARTYGALADYGVSDVFCSESDLDRFGLNTDDLVIPVTPLTDADIAALLARHTVTLSF